MQFPGYHRNRVCWDGLLLSGVPEGIGSHRLASTRLTKTQRLFPVSQYQTQSESQSLFSLSLYFRKPAEVCVGLSVSQCLLQLLVHKDNSQHPQQQHDPGDLVAAFPCPLQDLTSEVLLLWILRTFGWGDWRDFRLFGCRVTQWRS